MSYRFEFLADVADGGIALPADIAARLRLKSLDRVRVVITSVANEERSLMARGIDDETIARVATVQGYDRDVAFALLTGEGGARGGPLEDRLKELNSGADR